MTKKESPVSLSTVSLEKNIDKLDVVVNINCDIKDYNLLLSFLNHCYEVVGSMSYDFSNISKLMQMEQE